MGKMGFLNAYIVEFRQVVPKLFTDIRGLVFKAMGEFCACFPALAGRLTDWN
jgi:hypothetical protein